MRTLPFFSVSHTVDENIADKMGVWWFSLLSEIVVKYCHFIESLRSVGFNGFEKLSAQIRDHLV